VKKISFTIVLLLLTTFAHADNWVIITQSTKTGVTQYVDVDSIERNLGLVEMWRIFEHKPPSLRQANGKPLTSQKIRTEFDCPSRAMRQVSYTWYAGSMASGDIVNQMTVPDVWLIDKFDEFTLPLWKMACSDWEEK
jgi:hypothetical protein